MGVFVALSSIRLVCYCKSGSSLSLCAYFSVLGEEWHFVTCNWKRSRNSTVHLCSVAHATVSERSGRSYISPLISLLSVIAKLAGTCSVVFLQKTGSVTLTHYIPKPRLHNFYGACKRIYFDGSAFEGKLEGKTCN